MVNTGTTLRKQEAIVADPTASIEVVFWEDSTEMVEEGNTYMFSNFHVKGNSGQQRYVNTPTAEKCSTEITQMFTEPLVKVENLPSLTRVEVDVNHWSEFYQSFANLFHLPKKKLFLRMPN